MFADGRPTGAPIHGRARAEIDRLLATVAAHLGVDLVYLSHVTDEHQIIEATCGDPVAFGLAVDTVIPLRSSYCARVLAGELAYLVPDASADPVTSALPITREAGIGTYVGVPVRHRDGRLHGSLCCVTREPRADVTWREVRFMQAVAGIIADEIRSGDETDVGEFLDLRRLAEQGELTVHYQPIVRLSDDRTVGVEALTRFPDGTSPLPSYGAAATNGAHEVERLALDGALAALDRLPEPCFVAVNLSPATLLEPTVEDLLGSAPARRVVIEISELAPITDYDAVKAALEPALDRGVRLAVDDAGSSFSRLQHVLELSPDLVKLDAGLIRDVVDDDNARAVTEAILVLAGRMEADVAADGIESEEMRAEIAALGVPLAQGNHLGPPSPLPQLVRAGALGDVG